MRISVVTNLDNLKGLQRDWELLRDLLVSWGHDVHGVHFRHDKVAPKCDLMIFVETVEDRFFAASEKRWLIPNPEWWDPKDGRVAYMDKILCKTHDAHRIFSALAPGKAVYTGFLSADRYDATVERKRTFLHLPGGSAVKGTQEIVDAWRNHKIPHELIIGGQFGKGKLPAHVHRKPRLADAELARLQNECAFHLCPSAYEGFGHTTHEALSVGAAIITTDAPPMNEIEAVAARAAVARTEQLKSATMSWVSADSIHAAVEKAAALSDEDLAALREKARDEFTRGNAAFKTALKDLLTDSFPSVVPGTSPGTVTSPVRRSETPPRVAICFPAHVSGAELVRRSVFALRAQTADPSLFEVVVGADGGDPDGVLAKAIEPDSHPFAVKIVDSPRPRGEVPHRNHARNAAWRGASASLCAILDADFCLAPEFVEHLLSEHDAAFQRGEPSVFTPVLVGFGGIGPVDWLTASEPMVNTGDPDVYKHMLAEWPEIDTGIFSGSPEFYAPGQPRSQQLPDMVEGQPIVWRELLNVMGGFDEHLGEWGDDKIEFIDRLKALAKLGLFQLRLLNSTRALHQPHERDDKAFSKEAQKRQKYRRDHLKLIQTNAAWWRTKVTAVRDALPGIFSEIAQSIRRNPSEQASLSAAVAPRMDAGQVFGVIDALVSLALTKNAKDPRPILVTGSYSDAVIDRLKGADVVHVYVSSTELNGDLAIRPRMIIGLDLFLGLSGDEIDAFGKRLRSTIARGSQLVLAEITTLGTGQRSGRPNPIQIQRALPGLAVKRSQPTVDGRVYTIFTGRVSN